MIRTVTTLLTVPFVGLALCGQNGLADERVKNLFVDLCSTCHGVGGKGDGPSASGLHPKPADFTNCEIMKKDSDETLFNIIRGGGQAAGRSTVMPAWGGVLSVQEMRDLLGYVRSFCKK